MNRKYVRRSVRKQRFLIKCTRPACCLFILLSLLFTNAYAKKVVDRIVAIVNSEIVLLSDIENFREKLKTGGLVDEALLHGKDPKALMNDRKAIIDHLITEKLLDSRIKKQSLSITIERVEQEIRKIASDSNINRAQLKEALKARGVEFSDYQDFVKKSLERQSLIEKEVSSNIKISDEDVSDYYFRKVGRENAQVFEYTIAHIYFSKTNGGSTAAFERAKKVINRLEDGSATFENLASQYSEDPNFSQGGLWGVFKASELRKNFEQELRRLKVGDTSTVLESPGGFHIVKILRRNLVNNPQLEEEKNKIRNILLSQAFQTQFKNWIAGLKQDAFIRIN